MSGGSCLGRVATARSYKADLLPPRTFRPRFPASGISSSTKVWYTETTMRGKVGTTPSVWSRFGPGNNIHVGVGDLLHLSYDGSLLENLRAKSGRSCFNCFSPGHRIDFCRIRHTASIASALVTRHAFAKHILLPLRLLRPVASLLILLPLLLQIASCWLPFLLMHLAPRLLLHLAPRLLPPRFHLLLPCHLCRPPTLPRGGRCLER